MTYKLAKFAFLGDIVQHVLIKEAEHFPRFEHFDQVLHVLDIVGRFRSLLHQTDHVGDERCKLVKVMPLNMLHNGVHDVEVHELPLLFLAIKTQNLIQAVVNKMETATNTVSNNDWPSL